MSEKNPLTDEIFILDMILILNVTIIKRFGSGKSGCRSRFISVTGRYTSCRILISQGQYEGIEPSQTVSQTVMLPLHQYRHTIAERFERPIAKFEAWSLIQLDYATLINM